MATKIASKKGHHHNLIRASHYDDTHKYEKQRVRTAMNKAKHILKAKHAKKASDGRRAARRLWLEPLCWS